MQSKLEELTRKIYQEGVEKSNEEAEQIIKKAKEEASQILENANKDAKEIKENAEKNAAETLKNGEAELKNAFNKAKNDLKREITELISNSIINEPLNKSFEDTAFVKELIDDAIKNWESEDTPELVVILPAAKKKEFEKYIKTKSNGILSEGVKLNYHDELRNGFQIGPADGSYKLSFTEEDFDVFLKEFIRPKLKEILFEKEG